LRRWRNKILKAFHFILDYVAKSPAFTAGMSVRKSSSSTRINEWHIKVGSARNAKGTFSKLGCFAWPPMVGEAIAIHEQTKRKNTNSVFVEERPNFNIEFDYSDAAALANSDFAICCLYRDWYLYILYG